MKHVLKPYALGMMAQALPATEKTRPVAAELLAAAFDDMTNAVEVGKDVFNNMESAAVTAGSLLPVAEAIDPALVPEYLWRSISFRRPTPGPESHPGQRWFLDAASAALAMRVARYDPETARALIDPIVRRLASEPNTAVIFAGREVILAMALDQSAEGRRAAGADPRRGAQLRLATGQDAVPMGPGRPARPVR